MSLEVTSQPQLVLASWLIKPAAAIQHLGRLSLSRVIWMWIASFSSSSFGCLAWSRTKVSSHLRGWWFSHVCSVTADVSNVPIWHASWCPLVWSPALFWFHQCVGLAIVAGIQYTTFDCFSIGRGSFALVSPSRVTVQT